MKITVVSFVNVSMYLSIIRKILIFSITNIIGIITPLVWMIYGVLNFNESSSSRYNSYSNELSVFFILISNWILFYYFMKFAAKNIKNN